MDEKVTIMVPQHLAEGLYDMASAKDVTPGQIVRELLARELKRSKQAKTPNRADEPLVARLQRLLAADMASATSWTDLQRRLGSHGYCVKPAGGGLTVHGARGRRLCKSSELGFPYSRFVRKFCAPMPGHPHRMEHILMKIAAGRKPDGDDNLILIEVD